ncbi:hypothetical protein HPB50_001261 [Hyalomma asiaticum]|uniref:Uncharacterized protein n=1 Tax=Hyalomma asiaticum TaxID=266040 RepID=A0ACB7RLR5_HYAAI|nr:hypothetical protein HPB50_001261 [Hyalomma asiaticum]
MAVLADGGILKGPKKVVVFSGKLCIVDYPKVFKLPEGTKLHLLLKGVASVFEFADTRSDLVTPLKKRRLMRNSLDSVGGLSPATGEAAATLLSFQTPLLLHQYPEEDEQQPQQPVQERAPAFRNAQTLLIFFVINGGDITSDGAVKHGELVLQVQSCQTGAAAVAEENTAKPAHFETLLASHLKGEDANSVGSPLVDDPPTPLDDEGSVDWEEGPSPPAALGPRLLPPLTSGQPSPLELAGRTLEGGRRPPSAPRLPEPLPGPPDEDETTNKPVG